MTAFRDDQQEPEWDSMFFSKNPQTRYRLTTAAREDLHLADVPFEPAAGHVYLRLCRFNWCRDFRCNRRCASIIRPIGIEAVAIYNGFSDDDLDTIWNGWLLQGAEIEVGPPLPAGLVCRRGKGWFEQETT